MTDISPDERLIPAWCDEELQQVGKLEAHLLGLRHKAVSVFVMRDDQLLLQRRALGKYHTPGLWANTCCTHPNWGESGQDCASRRLEEELGIKGLVLNVLEPIEYRADMGNGMVEHEVVEMFAANVTGELALDLNLAEVMETRWVGLEQLRAEIHGTPEIFTPWLRIYMAEHAQHIWAEL